MGVKGDLLELIDAAPQDLRTLEGRLWRWTHHERARRAIERMNEGGGRSISFVSVGDVGQPSDMDMRVQVKLPSKWSIRHDGRLDVSDGERRWRGGAHEVTLMEPDHSGLHSTELGIMIAPGDQLLGAFTFAEPVEDEVSGRRCLRVDAAATAVHRRPAPFSMSLCGIDHTFWFDAATGILLRHVGKVDGETSSVSELSDLTINQPIGDRAFVFDAPPGTAVVRRIDQLIRMAEQQGADLSAVDRTDESAVQLALHATMRPQVATPAEITAGRRAKHIPVGPPPPDEVVARAAIESAFGHHNEVGEDGTTLVNVQGGENLAEPLRQAGTRIPDTDPSSITFVVDDVLFLRPDQAVVWFGVEVGGQRFAMVDGREGRAVLVDGRWMIEHATIVDLIGMAGVTAPPPGS